MADNWRTQKFPAAYYVLAAALLLMLVAFFVSDNLARFRNPDSREPEEVAKHVCWYQRRQFGKLSCSKKMVQDWTEMATDQMQLMQFWEGPAPEEPEEPAKPTPGDLVAAYHYRKAMGKYKHLLSTLEQRTKLWEENNETRGEFIFVPGKKGKTQEEMQKHAAKYLYQSNTRQYVLLSRYEYVLSMLKQLKSDPTLREAVEWVTRTPEEFLGQPLDCVRDCHGNCMKTWEGTTGKKDAENGQDCLLLKDLADAFTRANQRMCDDHKGEIQMKVCFRSNFHQAVMFVTNNNEGCSLEGERAGLMMPGNSSHEMGLAADILDRKQAEEYLLAEGIACGFIPDDDGHCSFAETAPNEWKQKWLGWKKKWKAWKKGWDMVHGR